MRQSRTMSVVEAIFSTAVGWALALVTQMLVFPVVGLQVRTAEQYSATVATA